MTYFDESKEPSQCHSKTVQFSKMEGQDIALVSPDGKNAFPVVLSSLLSKDDVAGRRTMEVDAEEYKNGHYR